MGAAVGERCEQSEQHQVGHRLDREEETRAARAVAKGLGDVHTKHGVEEAAARISTKDAGGDGADVAIDDQ